MQYPWMTLFGVFLSGLALLAGLVVAARRKPSPLTSIKAPPPTELVIDPELIDSFETAAALPIRLPKITLAADRVGRVLVGPVQIITTDCPILGERLLWPLMVEAKATEDTLAVVAPEWSETVLATVAANANSGQLSILPLLADSDQVVKEVAVVFGIEVTSTADLMSGYLPKPARLNFVLADSKECRYLVNTGRKPAAESNPG